jgi:hypothetical protein
MNEEWAKGWKPAAKSIREDFALVREKFQQTIQIINEAILTYIKWSIN